jgi:hypothetical protein
MSDASDACLDLFFTYTGLFFDALGQEKSFGGGLQYFIFWRLLHSYYKQ